MTGRRYGPPPRACMLCDVDVCCFLFVMGWSLLGLVCLGGKVMNECTWVPCSGAVRRMLF